MCPRLAETSKLRARDADAAGAAFVLLSTLDFVAAQTPELDWLTHEGRQSLDALREVAKVELFDKAFMDVDLRKHGHDVRLTICPRDANGPATRHATRALHAPGRFSQVD